MKNASRQIPAGSLEILEARIAPAGIFTFLDTDGDTVTVSSSRGTDADLSSALSFKATGFGFQLERIDFRTRPAVFQGTTLVISATPGAGLGNGQVDVGYIDARGLDLGSVTIDGDLAQIDAGDANPNTAGLRSLRAFSLGVRGLETQAAVFLVVDSLGSSGGVAVVTPRGERSSLESTILGGVGSLVLESDLRDATFQVLGSATDPDPNTHSSLDATGKIGAVRIAGSIIGGAAAGSGQIFAKGRIGTLTLGGSIVGGAGVESGRIWTEGGLDSAIIEGSIIGGTNAAATSSGQLFAGGKSSKILVKGKLTGGAGDDSGVISNGRGLGSVTILGGIEGGSGDGSGTAASAAKISLVSVTGGVNGGSGQESGVIRSTGEMTTVKIIGDVRGGTGGHSGLVGSADTIRKLTVEGSVFGGIGEQSGALGSIGALGDVKVTGDVRGASGPRSGQIVSTANIKSVTVDGSVVGGSAFESGAIGSYGGLGPVKIGSDLVAGAGAFSGTIQAGAEDPENGTPASITNVTIGGDIHGVVLSGTAGPNAAAILTDGALGPVIVLGDVRGGADDSVGTIVAATIKSVRIDGSLIGGTGEASGVVLASVSLGPVTIGHDVIGGDGESSGAIRSGGTMGAVKIAGTLTGGIGDFSGMIETQGEADDSAMGAVKITGAVIGGSGRNTGSIHSSGKLASVEAAELRGYSGTGARTVGIGSGSISSELDLGAVKIAGSVLGGTGDESGKITSGGKLASLTIGGNLSGGSGDYDTTAGDLDEIGQVFAAGALGPVRITGHVNGGDGAHSGEIRAASIASVNIGTYIDGGTGDYSGGLASTSGDIGPVTLGASIGAGSATVSGFVISARNLVSLRTTGMESELGGRVLISARNAITTLVATESIEDADIIAGIDIEQNYVNPGAQIGTVTIGTGTSGFVRAMNIVAGAVPGEDGDFGTFDDEPISGEGLTGTSKITKVVINGSILDPIGQLEPEPPVTGENFGIVADHVVLVIVAGQTISQHSGPRNDFIPIGESTLAINEMELD